MSILTGAEAPDTEGGPEPGASAEPSRRNHVLGVLSGTVGTLAFDFLHPELILVGMMYALTESKLLVALVTIISKAGMLAPQLAVSIHLEHRPRKRPYFIALTAVRATAKLLLIASIGLLIHQVTALRLTLFFTAYAVVCMCSGAGHVVFMDLVGRMIPMERIGSFFGTRQLLGGALSVLIGMVVIQPILGGELLGGVALPGRYLVLVAVGSVLGISGSLLFSLCHEQDGPRAEQRTTLAESLRRGLGWLRTDRNYRTYLWLRVAFRVNYLGLAFFVPYGKDRLMSADGAAGVLAIGGIMVATMKLSRTLASAAWGGIADRRGFRACLVGGGVCFFLAPVLALAAPVVPHAFAVPIPASPAMLDLPLLVYLAALFTMGAAQQASVIGGTNFLIRCAPPHRRISYVGFLNTVTSPLTLLPLAGAWLAGTVGLTSLFVLVAASGLFYLVTALRMQPAPARAVHGSVPGVVCD